MRIRRNSRLALFALLVLVNGCAGGETPAVRAASAGGTRLADAEKGFNPSAFNPPVAAILARQNLAPDGLETATMVTVAAPETVSGFRVQVMLTPEIDSANAVFETLTGALPDAWVYVVYDSPYYKVRVGNYTDRSEAAPMLGLLLGMGYHDAWIVPDNVLQPPPPRLSPELIDQERPIDRRM